MGNLFGKDENSLSFRGIHTENFSENIPYLEKLEQQSKMLAERIKTAQNFQESENKDMYKLFEQSKGLNSENLSDTSPFINTDGYKSIIDNVTSENNTEIKQFLQKQTGGNFDTFITPEMFNGVNNTEGTSVNNTEFNNYLANAMSELTSATERTVVQNGGYNEIFMSPQPIYNGIVNQNNDIGITSTLKMNYTQQGGDMEGMPRDDSSSSSSSSENKSLSYDIQEDMDHDKEKNNLEDLEEKIMEAMDESELNAQSDMDKTVSEMIDEELNMNTQSSLSGGSKTVSRMQSERYTSSSAHSDGIESNTNVSSTISVGNDKYLSESINTSDINMISVE
jgi:hypothetical protein